MLRFRFFENWRVLKKKSLTEKNWLENGKKSLGTQCPNCLKFQLFRKPQGKLKGYGHSSGEKITCLIVKLTRNEIWRFFDCLFSNDDNARLVIDLSLTFVIIVSYTVPKHSCRMCKIVKKILLEDCIDFLH